MSNNDIETISKFIIQQAKENSSSHMSGFQYIVDYDTIKKAFKVELEEETQEQILDTLLGCEEVADAEIDCEGFDVVLYTAFSPNYDHEEFQKD